MLFPTLLRSLRRCCKALDDSQCEFIVNGPVDMRSLIWPCSLLDEIRCRLEDIEGAKPISRIVHLNRNERTLQCIKAQLDDAYRDLVVRPS
jgi:hypothetical protein